MSAVLDVVEKNKDKFKTVASFVIPIILLAVTAPFLKSAFNGAVAAIGIFILYLVSITVIPVLSTKLANWKFNALVEEAKNNPMPTIFYRLEQREKAYKDIESKVIQGNAALESYIVAAQKALNAGRNQEDRDKWQKRIPVAGQKIEHNRQELKKLRIQLADYREQVKYASVEWDAIVAERAANVSMDLFNGTPMDQLLERTSLKAIDDGMNISFERMYIATIGDDSDSAKFEVKPEIKTLERVS